MPTSFLSPRLTKKQNKKESEKKKRSLKKKLQSMHKNQKVEPISEKSIISLSNMSDKNLRQLAFLIQIT